jgi:hypothetical protein
MIGPLSGVKGFGERNPQRRCREEVDGFNKRYYADSGSVRRMLYHMLLTIKTAYYHSGHLDS